MSETFDDNSGEEVSSNPASDDAEATGPLGVSAAPAPGTNVPATTTGPLGVSAAPAPGVNVPATNGMATAGGVVGIVGLVLSLIPIVGIFIGFVMGILAIIFGSVGLARYNTTGAGSKGLAMTGLVLGIITVVLKLIPGIGLL